jgi:hypothetical protein
LVSSPTERSRAACTEVALAIKQVLGTRHRRAMALEIIVARELRARGDQTRSLEHGARNGLFVRIRPGVYAVSTEWHSADPVECHRAVMDALVATSARVHVFSHESAALVHGIPVVGRWPALPHVIAADSGHRPPANVIAHRPRHPWLIGVVGDVMATTPACTAINLAASRSLAAGVAALDHVIALGTSKDDLAAMIAEWRPFHGVRKAVRALEIATGLAETPLESISLVPIALAGFERPEQQVVVVARGRSYRLDFLWRRHGVVGEADGRIKYLSPSDLWDEKQREDAIRSLDLGFARWGWDEALAGPPVVARLHEAGLRVGPPLANRASRIA